MSVKITEDTTIRELIAEFGTEWVEKYLNEMVEDEGVSTNSNDGDVQYFDISSNGEIRHNDYNNGEAINIDDTVSDIREQIRSLDEIFNPNG